MPTSRRPPAWIRGVTPAHGMLSTHLATDDDRTFARDPDFPLTLVFNRSQYRYAEPWYYGVSHGMALVLTVPPAGPDPHEPVALAAAARATRRGIFSI